MATTIKIFGKSRLTVGAHYDFHSRALALIETATAEELKIAALLPTYQSAVETEGTIVKRPITFLATTGMKNYDKKRDYLLGVIFQVVYSHKNSPIALKKQASEALSAVLSTFRGITKHEYTRQTSEVKSMIAALKDLSVADYLDTLGITSEVDELATVNAEFETEMNNKQREVSSRTPITSLNTRQVRAQTDAAYNAIVSIVNAHAVISSSDIITQFVTDMNALISMFRIIAANQGKTSLDAEGEITDSTVSGSAE